MLSILSIKFYHQSKFVIAVQKTVEEWKEKKEQRLKKGLEGDDDEEEEDENIYAVEEVCVTR